MTTETIGSCLDIIKIGTSCQTISSSLVGKEVQVSPAVCTGRFRRTGAITARQTAIVATMIPLVLIRIFVTSHQASVIFLYIVPILASGTVYFEVCCIDVACGAVKCYSTQFTCS